MADIDRDGTMDLIAEFVASDDPNGLLSGEAVKILDGRRVVVAVSGRSGKELWNYPIDRKTVDLPFETLDHGITYVPHPKGPFVALVDGSKVIGLDPKTGRLRSPTIELGFAPAQPVQYMDLDGDGSIDLLALEPDQGNEPLTVPSLAAFSSATGKRIWVKNKLMAYYRPKPAVPVRDWPLAADLDGDGRAEVVIPHRRFTQYGQWRGLWRHANARRRLGRDAVGLSPLPRHEKWIGQSGPPARRSRSRRRWHRRCCCGLSI